MEFRKLDTHRFSNRAVRRVVLDDGRANKLAQKLLWRRFGHVNVYSENNIPLIINTPIRRGTSISPKSLKPIISHPKRKIKFSRGHFSN